MSLPSSESSIENTSILSSLSKYQIVIHVVLEIVALGSVYYFLNKKITTLTDKIQELEQKNVLFEKNLMAQQEFIIKKMQEFQLQLSQPKPTVVQHVSPSQKKNVKNVSFSSIANIPSSSTSFKDVIIIESQPKTPSPSPNPSPITIEEELDHEIEKELNELNH